MIEVVRTAGLATVQDLGRLGGLRFGVGTAGAMDRVALAAANILLGNDENDAGVEVPIFPFAVRFGADCAFALAGADCGATLAGRALLPWWAHRARAGEELVLNLPIGRRASRAYLALPGGVDVPAVLGSRSTQLRGAFGGFDGRALQVGDVLRPASPHGDRCAAGFGLVPPEPLPTDGVAIIRVLPAAEYPHLRPASRDAFWQSDWKITAQSDRYGYRLSGEALGFAEPLEMLSHGIVPGVIQLPPGGQPIVQMSDAQPSGGYPKLGTVIEADFWRLGQAPVGSRIRFREAGWDEAVVAGDALRAWLDEAARCAGLQRWQRERMAG